MKKELTTNNFEYEIIYCNAKDFNNSDMWHFTYGDLQRISDIIAWCKEKNLIIKRVKAVKI